MATSMQQRRGTAAEWTASNEVLPDGAVGVEEFTGLFKIGDGHSGWNELPYSAISLSMIDNVGDLIVGSGDGTVVTLARGDTEQVLAVKSDGTLYWTDPTVSGSTITAAGDLIVGSGAGTVSRLGKGSNGQQLAVVAGNLAWVTSPDVPLATVTAAEDLIVGSGAAAVKRLGKGSNGQILTVVGGVLTWANAAGGAVPLSIVDAAGDLIVGSGNDTVARMAKGPNNTVLTTVGSGLQWIALGEDVSVSVFSQAGDLVVGTGPSTYYVLPPGANGQVLKIVAGVPAWVTPAPIKRGSFTIALAGGVSALTTVYFDEPFATVPTVVANAGLITGNAAGTIMNVSGVFVDRFTYKAQTYSGSYTGNVPGTYIASAA